MWAVALERTLLTYFEVEPHCRFEMHAHQSERITMVLEGTLHFDGVGGTTSVGAGEVFAIPSYAEHAAVTRDSRVCAVDAWSPVRPGYRGGHPGER
jgi:quercetin dioxygenase-like cupin family protein